MPPRLVPLIECGVIDSVVRPLLSGKEAQVYLVECDGHLRAAKVYKSANERSFKHRSEYTEGRTVRNSRDQRAIEKRTRHGRERDEATWTSAEADTIYKLDAAGVRVPKPFAFIEGVLVMECIEGPDGGPAPRLAECTLEPAYARIVFDQLIREVVKMLCADVVHGDLSVFNVLIEEAGPVVIDFPQAVDAAHNLNARAILLRDVANLTSHFLGDRPLHERRHGYEMWALYERGELRPEVELTGRFDLPRHEVDAELLLQEMWEVDIEEDATDDMGDFDFDRAPRRARPPKPAASESGGTPPKGRGGRGKPARPAPEVVIKGRPPEPAPVPPPAPVEASTRPPRGERREGDARPPRSGRPPRGPAPGTPAEAPPAGGEPRSGRSRRRSGGGGGGAAAAAAPGRDASAPTGPPPTSRPPAGEAPSAEGPPKRRRRRRRSRGGGGGGGE